VFVQWDARSQPSHFTLASYTHEGGHIHTEPCASDQAERAAGTHRHTVHTTHSRPQPLLAASTPPPHLVFVSVWLGPFRHETLNGVDVTGLARVPQLVASPAIASILL
jgi:hypothetical protein